MEIKCFYCAAAAFILLLTDTPTSDVVREMQKKEKHYDNTIRPKLFFLPKKGLYVKRVRKLLLCKQLSFFKWY